MSINSIAFEDISPHLPPDKIERAFFIGVNGVLNSCETIEIKLDFICSNFLSSLFFSLILLYKQALFSGNETCLIIVWKYAASSVVSGLFLKISIQPKNCSPKSIGANKLSYSKIVNGCFSFGFFTFFITFKFFSSVS